jgi:hypothetical protein
MNRSIDLEDLTERLTRIKKYIAALKREEFCLVKELRRMPKVQSHKLERVLLERGLLGKDDVPESIQSM